MFPDCRKHWCNQSSLCSKSIPLSSMMQTEITSGLSNLSSIQQLHVKLQTTSELKETWILSLNLKKSLITLRLPCDSFGGQLSLGPSCCNCTEADKNWSYLSCVVNNLRLLKFHTKRYRDRNRFLENHKIFWYTVFLFFPNKNVSHSDMVEKRGSAS